MVISLFKHHIQINFGNLLNITINLFGLQLIFFISQIPGLALISLFVISVWYLTELYILYFAFTLIFSLPYAQSRIDLQGSCQFTQQRWDQLFNP